MFALASYFSRSIRLREFLDILYIWISFTLYVFCKLYYVYLICFLEHVLCLSHTFSGACVRLISYVWWSMLCLYYSHLSEAEMCIHKSISKFSSTGCSDDVVRRVMIQTGRWLYLRSERSMTEIDNCYGKVWKHQ